MPTDFVNTSIARHSLAKSTTFASAYRDIEVVAYTRLLYKTNIMAAGTKDKADTHKIALRGEPAAVPVQGPED